MQQPYLRTTSPLLDNECGDEWKIQNGECVDELVLDSCHPLHSLCNPPKPQCVGDIPLTPELEKLCEIADNTAEEVLNVFDGSISPLGKCTPEGLPILVCKITNETTGESIFQTHAPTGENGVLEPYVGECVECNKQYNPIDQWVSDPASPFCDYRLFECDGEKFIYNPESCEYENILMGTLTTPYQPSGDKVCREAQIGPFELAPGATDIATIVADAIAAEAPVFDFNGTEVAVTADDVSFFKITPKACDTLTSTGEMVTVDYVNINAIATSNHIDDKDGGVNGATAVEVPVGGCGVVELCFESCLSKQQIAALSKG